MIKLKKKLLTNLGKIFLIMLLMQVGVFASQLKYQEKASDLIITSLQQQKNYRFLKNLYKELFFIPIWTQENKLSKLATSLFAYIKNDKTLNRRGKIYQNTLLFEKEAQRIYTNKAPLSEKIALEFKISQLYEAYTNYAYFGSINWGAFNARISNLMVNDVSTEWVLHRPNFDAVKLLERAVFGASLKKELQKSIPSKYHYKALQKELIKYKKIQNNGGWNFVQLEGKLRQGKPNTGVPGLRERLSVTHDFVPCKNNTEGLIYDTCLEKAVKRFQKRNGLTPDGNVGPSTLAVLNKTVEERITTIRLNLDRIKWLKERKDKRHIIINIPDFMLYFEEDGKLKQSIKTVVGKPNHPTPIFSNEIKTVVLNPYWNLPTSIIQKEMIPKMLKHPKILKKKGIEVYDGWGKNAKKVNPAKIDWTKYMYSKRVPYRFAQIPGKHNALGKLKFLFPNKYSVYMHDTPAKSLFNKTKRAFSHGCIRLHKPRALLKTLSTFESNLDFKKSQKILKGKEKTYFALPQHIPVDVIYLTAWVDYDGKIQFRNDIYGYDKMQLKSFRRW